MTCMTFRPVLLPAIAVAIVSSVCAAPAQESNGGFLGSIFGGSDRFSHSGQQAPAAESGQVTAQGSGSDLVVRLDRLERQIRQLTGAIEQLQYRNQQLEAELHGGRGGAPASVQTRPGGYQAPAQAPTYQAPAQAPAANGRRSDVFDPAAHPNAPGAPHTLGSTATSVPPAYPQVAEAPTGGDPGGRQAGTPLDLSTLAGNAANDPSLGSGGGWRHDNAPRGSSPRGSSPSSPRVATLPPSDSPKDNFDLAYGYVLRRDYALAESSFRAFLEKFPNDRLTPDAQYWLGESLYQRRQYRDAAEAFLNVSTKFETAGKAPDALLRLGQSLAALGEKEAACASLGEVLRKYPRASVAIKQGVEREQKRAHC
jgi:tol-pal system protein YbgF